MKVAGIIAEYNPFHNGHAYHIEEVRRKTGADYVVVVMSGNFVQRGAPAIIDKYTRTRMALHGGADLVIELPVAAATASAETFARSGIAILNALGVVTHLGFGCETENLKLLDVLADLFVEEPTVYLELLSDYLKEGLSYPAARARAAKKYFSQVDDARSILVDDGASLTETTCKQNLKTKDVFSIEQILNNPNNILAIEYLKALKKTGSTIEPCPILRLGNGYHSQNISGGYASATAIRTKMIEFDIYDTDMSVYNVMVPEELAENLEEEHEGFLSFLKHQIPESCTTILCDALKTARPLAENDFSKLLHYKLCLEQGDYSEYADVKSELANRIISLQENYFSFTGFVEELKTKNMTYTGISRALLHILLDMKQSDVALLEQLKYAPYIRLLGFRKASAQLLNELKQISIPVLSQIAKDQKKLSDAALRLLQLDISASHIYSLVKTEKSGISVEKNEYRTPLVYV